MTARPAQRDATDASGDVPTVPADRRVAVIVNAQAGGGHDEAWAHRLVDVFRDGGLDADVTFAQGGDDVIAAGRRAVADRYGIVVAGGGDGTISAVASTVAGSGVAFGVLALGTLNHFAKDLGIPLDPDEAVKTIIAGHSIAVDVGDVNGRTFINNCGLGIYPSIVRHRVGQQKRYGRSKWVAFAWATIAALRRYPFLTVSLLIDGERIVRRSPFVFIGNNRYVMEGLDVGERRRLDAGELSVYVAQRPGRLGLLRFAVQALFGRLKQAKDFDAMTAAEFTIETRHRRLHVATDGEVGLIDSPLHFRSRPGALRVFVPLPPTAE